MRLDALLGRVICSVVGACSDDGGVVVVGFILAASLLFFESIDLIDSVEGKEEEDEEEEEEDADDDDVMEMVVVAVEEDEEEVKIGLIVRSSEGEADLLRLEELLGTRLEESEEEDNDELDGDCGDGLFLCGASSKEKY